MGRGTEIRESGVGGWACGGWGYRDAEHEGLAELPGVEADRIYHKKIHFTQNVFKAVLQKSTPPKSVNLSLTTTNIENK